jgi:hypothetical protein
MRRVAVCRLVTAAALGWGAASLPACGAAFNAADAPGYEVALAGNGAGLALAWHGGALPHSAIWLRWAAPDGRPQGAALKLSDATRDAYEPDLVLLGDRLLVAWYEKDARTGALTAELAGFDLAGRLLWQRALSAAGHDGRNPVLRAHGDILHAAWLEGARVWSASFDAAGEIKSAAREVAQADTDTWNLNAALDRQGTFYVVYDAVLSATVKQLQLLKISDAAVLALTLDTGAACEVTYPDIAVDEARAALSWIGECGGRRGAYLWVGARAAVGARPLRGRQISHAAARPSSAYLAFNGSRLGMAWNEQHGAAVEVWFEGVDAQGAALGAAQRLSRTTGQSLVPAIHRWRRGFAVAWNDYRAAATPALSPASVVRLSLIR